ncbi:hypothetical protein [Vampirovibrio sp.]|uniref:hypothetical protein n=1 Tax=Vampirovibrio sp. TaxID=2717857 RepID=UPI00359342FB
MSMFDRLESLFLEMEQRTGLKKHRILLEAGIDPAQYRAYKRASRCLSDDMLDRLGKSSHVHLSVERLRAWKAIDEFGPAVLREAIQVLEEEVSLDVDAP